MTLFSFPKTKRLLNRRQYYRVNKYGRLVHGKFLTIQVCECHRSTLKLGLTVSRKFGKATKRNHFKRLVREAFRLSQHQLPTGVHLNIRPARRFEEATFEKIKKELCDISPVSLIT